MHRLRSPSASADKRVKRLKRLKRRLRTQEREMESLRMLSRPPMFFIVGEAKSGTSWLMRTFNAHPEILCRGEGRFFGCWYKDASMVTTNTRRLGSCWSS
jgi:hypothetical protein